MGRIPVALQLYTVRDLTPTDFVGTVTKVAQMGYAGVEMAGVTGGLSAKELKKLFDDLGLRVAGSHIGIDILEKDPAAVADFNLTIGNPYLVVPYMPKEAMNTLEGAQALAQRLNKLAQTYKPYGLKVAYHNHAHEFVRVGDRYALELLYDQTDPVLVQGEPDLYWVTYGNEDPVAWLKNHPGRCPLVHLKDMAPGPERTFAEVGEGIINWQPVFAAAETAGAQWYIVEQDRCQRPTLESAALSLKHLKEWGIA